MPDLGGIIEWFTQLAPQLSDSFVAGVKLAAAGFVLVGIVYFLRRTL